uniref:Ubiquitin-like protease family profile domain-containing protein n=1 Tax=Chenopodium quinoa TaxID=63459 RepID=A0A803KUY6_CHEQI
MNLRCALSEKGKENAKNNKHLHHLGSKSYERDRVDWSKTNRIPAESSTSSTTESTTSCVMSEKLKNRSLYWILAHQTRNADGSWAIDPKNAETQQIANAIGSVVLSNQLENLQKNDEGNNSSDGIGMDALDKALGKKDHRGHVKALGRCGVGVSHTQVFGKGYRKEEKVEEKLQERIEERIKERLEQRVAMEVKAYLANLLPQMSGDVEAFQGMQVMTNMESTQSPRVLEVATKCRLALKDEYNQNLVVVADGTVYHVTGEVTHNLKMLPNHYRVSVDNPYPDCALLDIPVPSPVTKLGKAKSSFVLWPIDMVFFEEEVLPSPKKKHRSPQSKEGDDSCGVKSRQSAIKPTKFLPLEDKIVGTFGEVCELLYWLMNSDDAKYDKTSVLLKASMFNFDSDKQIWVTATDVREFLRGSWANVSLIHVYIMYLVDNFIDLFNRTDISFFCPQLISESSIENDYLETYTYVKNIFLHEVRKTGKRCKFIVAPYVASGHWVLVVVDLQLGLAYEFDSMKLPKEKPRQLKIAEIMMT